MTAGPRMMASVILSIICFMPVTASAITPTDTTDDDPVTETPVDEDPVVENPDPDPDNELKMKAEDRLTKEKERPVKEKPKKVAVVPKTSTPTKVYPVPSKSNFCPQGLQPVTISGVISCGSPTTTVTYNQMLAHPKPARAKRHVTYHHSARPTCTPGLKGCSDR